MNYPECLEKVIGFLKRLPGIGEKSAERMALSFLEYSEEDLNDFSKTIKKIKIELHPCSICGSITDNDVCKICEDHNRDKSLICVLEDDKSVFAFEKAGNYKGTYHVLGGLLSPVDKIDPEDLNIAALLKRVSKMEKCELVIALKSTLEGEMTTLYLKKILDKKKVSISRLSYGIPVGAEIEYLDAITLDKALADRKIIS